MIQRSYPWRGAVVPAGLAILCAVTVAAPLRPARAASRAAATSVQLVGAGSTFDLPFFTTAFRAYQQQKHDVSVNYQGIGSGGGIKQFTANTIDFGATDVPMNADELALANRTGSATIQIPIALGGVAIAYNLPQLGAHRVIKLDGSTLARIFMRQITRWNDKAIAALNPSLKLPDLSILPVHRSDASGTTYITSDYLSSVDRAWSRNYGTGKTVAWPADTLGGKGNPGVAAAIKQHSGAIGYVELAYAIDNKMPYAELKNKATAYLFPTQATVGAAAAQFPRVSYKSFSIVNAPGRTSYPIAGYSWVLLRQQPQHNATELVALFRWLVTGGQTYAGRLKYVPLPSNVRTQALMALGRIK